MIVQRLGMVAIAAVLSFSVAAKPPELPLPLADELVVEVVLDQHELAVNVPATASQVGAQFGLIGAIVGSAVQNSQVKKAEEGVAPVRDQLLGYGFDEAMKSKLRARLPSEGISPNPSITIMQSPWDAAEAQHDLEQMPLRALVLRPRYTIGYDFRTLAVTLDARLVERTIKASGKVKTVVSFMGVYGFNYPMTDIEGDDPQPWVDLGPERLAQLLDGAATQVVDMLVYDLSAAGRAERQQKVKREQVVLKGQTFAGRAVSQDEDFVWVRNGNRHLSVINGYQPLVPGAGMTAPDPAAQLVTAPADPVGTEAPLIEADMTGAAAEPPMPGVVDTTSTGPSSDG